jgi:hypothetical protein
MLNHATNKKRYISHVAKRPSGTERPSKIPTGKAIRSECRTTDDASKERLSALLQLLNYTSIQPTLRRCEFVPAVADRLIHSRRTVM